MNAADLKIGECAVVTGLSCDGKLKLRLLELGFTRGAKIELRRSAPLKGPVQLFLRGYELTLRRSEAKKIAVRPVK